MLKLDNFRASSLIAKLLIATLIVIMSSPTSTSFPSCRNQLSRHLPKSSRTSRKLYSLADILHNTLSLCNALLRRNLCLCCCWWRPDDWCSLFYENFVTCPLRGVGDVSMFIPPNRRGNEQRKFRVYIVTKGRSSISVARLFNLSTTAVDLPMRLPLSCNE